MKRIPFVLSFLLCLSLFNGELLAQGWISQLSGTSEMLYGVHFSNANSGVVVGGLGTILRTTNGGTTWTSVPSGTTRYLVGLSFANATTGAAVGEFGTILRTTNGGLSWTTQNSSTAGYLVEVSLIDTNIGAVVGESGTILRTTSGGTTWIQQTSGTGNWLFGVFFTDANTGTAVGDFGTILRTTNGGTTWAGQNSNTSAGLWGVWFTDANTGTVVGTGGTILRTTNGGAGWTSQVSGTSATLYRVQFSSASTGTAVGDGGTILRTTDSGVTWVQQTSGTTNFLFGVHFTSRDTGTAVGSFGTILRTTTGGRGLPTLTVVSPNGGEFWVVGTTHNIVWTNNAVDSVKLEYTTNNGTTWITIVPRMPAGAGSYPWIIPSTSSSQARVRLSDVGNPAINDVSDGLFTITPPPAITLSVDSLSFTVSEGDSIAGMFTIGNGGTGILAFSIDHEFLGGALETEKQIQREREYLSSTTEVTLRQLSKNPSDVIWGRPRDNKVTVPTAKAIASGVSSPHASLPTVVTDSVGDGGAVDIREIRGASTGGNLTLQLVLATPLNPFNFGGYLGLDTDQDRFTGILYPFADPAQDIGCEYFVDFFSLGSNLINVFNANGIFLGAVPATSDSNSFTFSVPLSLLGSDDGLVDLAAVVGNSAGPTDWIPNVGHGAVGPNWLGFSPTSGTIQPAGSMDINVNARSAGLVGGTYRAIMHVRNNDPLRATADVSVRLRVIGTPNITVAPDTLEFGDAFIGYADTLVFAVGNTGSDTLRVSGMTTTNPRFSVVDNPVFIVPPFGSRSLGMIFQPDGPGVQTGNLSISSNDPGDPVTNVLLRGTGVPPPIIGVAPDSLSFTLNEGDSITATLTINNTGQGSLTFSIANEYLLANSPGMREAFREREQIGASTNQVSHPSPSRSIVHSSGLPIDVIKHEEIIPALQRRMTLAGDTVRVFIVRSFGTVFGDPINTWNFLNANFAMFGSQPLLIDYVTLNIMPITYTDLVNSRADVLYISDAWDPASPYGSYTQSEIDAITNYVNAGHGLIISSGTLNTALQPTHNRFAPLLGLDEAAFYRWNDGFSYTGTTISDFLHTPHPIFDSIPSPYIPNVTSSVAVTGGWQSALLTGQRIAESTPPDSGIIVVRNNCIYVSTVPEIVPNLNDLRLLYNAMVWSGGGERWLSETPVQGTVPPGGSLDVTVKVRTDQLDGGLFRAKINVTSNDPARPRVSVPVRLMVIGRPNLVASHDTLDFGEAFINYPDTLVLQLSNNGSDTLRVSGMTASNPLYSLLGSTVFAVAPRGRHDVPVRFLPTSLGVQTGVLAITSNDPGDPVTNVQLRGEGINPSQITVMPDSFGFTLNQGDSASATLSIGNQGLGSLHWQISIGGVGFANSTADRSVVRSVPRGESRDEGSASTGSHRRLSDRASGHSYPPGGEAVRNAARAGSAVDDETLPTTSHRSPMQSSGARLFGAALGSISEIDISTGLVLNNFPAPDSTSDGPTGLAFSGDRLFFTDAFTTSLIYVLDPSTGTVVASYPAPSAFIDGLAFVDGMLYACDYSALQIYELNADNGQVLRTIIPPVAIGGGIDGGGGRLFASNFTNAIYELDISTGAVLNSFVPLSLVYGVGFSGTRLFTSAPGTGIMEYDPNTGQFLGSVSALSFAALAGGGVDWLRVVPDSGIVPAGGSENVSVRIQTGMLNGGTYQANMLVQSNDPARPTVVVPVRLDLIGSPSQFTINGSFSEPGYRPLATKLNNNSGFGPDEDLTNIYYGVDSANIYLGFEGRVQNVPNQFNPKPDGFGVFLNFTSEQGAPAGGRLGFLTPVDYHFMNGVTGKVPSPPFFVDFKMAFEVDYMLAYYSDGTPNVIILDAGTHVANNPDSVQFIGSTNQSGTAVSGPFTPGVFSTGSVTFAFQRSLVAGSRKGAEIRIPFAEFGATPADSFQLFAALISSTAYFSDVTIPGNVTSGNSGFDPNYLSNTNSTYCQCPSPGGTIGAGPYYTALGNGVLPVKDPLAAVPQTYELYQNYPNPFNPQTRIRFSLVTMEDARLDIFDILGRHVRVLVNEQLPAGGHEVVWDGKGDHGEHLASGVYIYRIAAGSFVSVKKMLMLK